MAGDGVSWGQKVERPRNSELVLWVRKIPQSDLLRYGSQKDNVRGATEMS